MVSSCNNVVFTETISLQCPTSTLPSRSSTTCPHAKMADEELSSQRGKKMEIFGGVKFTYSHETQHGLFKMFRCYRKMECKAM